MNINFQIKSRWDAKVLFEMECGSLKICLEAAVSKGAYLTGAYLTGAYLTGAYLKGAYLKGADLTGAYLKGADLTGAYLTGAYLKGAYLKGADLTGAYLKGADLTGAYLTGADLTGADLTGAYGVSKYITTPLRILLDQPGKLRAYKLVGKDLQSPMAAINGFQPIKYAVGKFYEVKNADKNEDELCSSGINVATLDWCLKEWKEGWRLLLLEFNAKDIAAIPTNTDGKFRVRKAKVVKELKLSDYDWPPAPAPVKVESK